MSTQAQAVAGETGLRLSPVLLVEDSTQDAEIALRIFRRARLLNPVERVVDGAEALQRLLDAALPAPALVLLDLHLPSVSGWEVLEKLQTCSPPPAMPIIVLVSSDRDQARLRSVPLPRLASASKPVAITELMALLSTLDSTDILSFSAPAS